MGLALDELNELPAPMPEDPAAGDGVSQISLCRQERPQLSMLMSCLPMTGVAMAVAPAENGAVGTNHRPLGCRPVQKGRVLLTCWVHSRQVS